MKTKLGTLLFLSLILLLSVNACGPTPPPSKLVGLWRFAKMDTRTVEFRPDSTFIMTNTADKSIFNQGAYVVDDAKDPARIDITGLPERPFEFFGVDSGAFKGLIRFRNTNVAEIAFVGPSAYTSVYPKSFDEAGAYIVVIYRIQK